MRTHALILSAVALATVSCLAAEKASPSASAFPVPKLPPGYVRGDVVSYSYVPNRYWGREEGYGILPYLWEYAPMLFSDKEPLETFHKENVRRIDLISQWSTVVELYARRPHFRDEVINLMIRAFKHRQLLILRDYIEPRRPDRIPLATTTAILDKLWENRDRPLTNPEGDQATGRQLINNILAIKLGDEGLHIFKTEGVEEMHRLFREKVQGRVIDGQRPFRHIKSWYNDMHYGAGTFAATEEDVAQKRPKWPANCEFVGVDAYHYYFLKNAPFDPDDPKVPRQRLVEEAIRWQNVITKYYGPFFRVSRGRGWMPEYQNDTHAMLQAMDLAGADRAMLFFIGLSSTIPGMCYRTPVETMDAYYDSLKAGPWVGLSWWVFDAGPKGGGTLDYLDKKLKHYTPEHPEGVDYSPAELERFREQFIASRMRMFRDVVYNQFGYLNGPAPDQKGNSTKGKAPAGKR